MKPYLIGAGLIFFGFVIGFFTAALLAASGRADEDIERELIAGQGRKDDDTQPMVEIVDDAVRPIKQ